MTGSTNGAQKTYLYDNAGSIVTEQIDSITRTYDYNYHQRIKEITEDSTTLGEYTYDALGRRTKKVASGTTTYYIYSQSGQLIEECDAAGTWQKDYVYFNAQPLVMVDTGGPETLYYYHNDHLGTPQKMTDSTATVVWEAAYLPFGKAAVNENPDGDGETVTSNLRFPGQYFDQETGLHYNWWRYYDAETGRYMRSDPIGLEGGMNLYSYASGSPIKNMDPTGLCNRCDDCPGGIWSGAGVGGQGYILSGGLSVGVYRVQCWSSNKTCFISAFCAGTGFGLGLGASVDSLWFFNNCNSSDLEGRAQALFGGGGIGAWGAGGTISDNGGGAGVGYGAGGGYAYGHCVTSIISCN